MGINSLVFLCATRLLAAWMVLPFMYVGAVGAGFFATYGYTARGGPVGVGTATAKSIVLNTVMVHLVGMVGTRILWGTNPRAPIGG